MKTLIIGGGLSGLALAENLESQEREYLLVEAQPRSAAGSPGFQRARCPGAWQLTVCGCQIWIGAGS